MTEFESSVNDLAETIESSPEYVEFEEVEEKYQNNDKVQELLKEIRMKENEIQIAKNKDADQDKVDDLYEEYNQLYEELNDLDVSQDYNEATEQLERVLSEVNAELSESLGLNFAEIVVRSESESDGDE